MPAGVNPGDIDMMARTMWAENENASPQEYAAIANVMRNRLQSGNPQYGGNTMSQVLLAKNQFTPWNDPSAKNYPMKAAPRDPAYQSAYRIASDVMTGNADDPTNGATNYHATSMKSPPSWAVGQQGQKIGAHKFYRLDDDKSYLSQFEKQQAPIESQPGSSDDKDYLSQFEKQQIPEEEAQPNEPPTPTGRVAGVFEQLPATALEPPIAMHNMQVGRNIADFIKQHPYISGGAAGAAVGLAAPELAATAVTAGIPLAAKGLWGLGKEAAKKFTDYEILLHLLRP